MGKEVGRAERLAEEKVALAEAQKAILADVQAERDYLLQQLDEKAAIAAQSVAERDEAVEKEAKASAHSESCRPTIERLTNELKVMTQKERDAVGLHKSQLKERQKESEQHEAEMARLDMQVIKARERVPALEEELLQLKLAAAEREEADRRMKEEMSIEEAQQERAAVKIQAIYRGRMARRRANARAALVSRGTTPGSRPQSRAMMEASMWCSEEDMERIEAMRASASWLPRPESEGGKKKKKKKAPKKEKEKTPEQVLAEEHAAMTAELGVVAEERKKWDAQRAAMREGFAKERRAREAAMAAKRLQIQMMIGFAGMARRLRYQDGLPPSDGEVTEYMQYLTITDPELRWLALEAMTAPTPWGWTVHYHPETLEHWYHHKATDTKSFEHPIDRDCRGVAVSLEDALVAAQWEDQKAEKAAAEGAAWEMTEAAVDAAKAAAVAWEDAVKMVETAKTDVKEFEKEMKKEKDKARPAWPLCRTSSRRCRAPTHTAHGTGQEEGHENVAARHATAAGRDGRGGCCRRVHAAAGRPNGGARDGDRREGVDRVHCRQQGRRGRDCRPHADAVGAASSGRGRCGGPGRGECRAGVVPIEAVRRLHQGAAARADADAPGARAGGGPAGARVAEGGAGGGGGGGAGGRGTAPAREEGATQPRPDCHYLRHV
jgi:hypothetical protein